MLASKWASAAAAPLIALAAGAACAQVRTDASLGRPPQSLTGPQYLIPESLGALRGANLFHSFSVFNIASGQSATFTTTTLGIANVISRVTGGDPSSINGLLRLSAADGKPSFFFINPAGVTFGAGAIVDVPGAFHVSTADYVKFADGKFYADPSAGSTLSSAAPEAFGFLGTQRAAVNVNGVQLFTSVLQPFSIVAGDVGVNGGRVATRGGDIRIVAIGNRQADVPLTGALPDASGRLTVVNGGSISAPSGTYDAGHVSVSAGDIYLAPGTSTVLTGIFSQANAGSSGNAGVIDVRAANSIQILDGATISSSTFTAANAGSVTVKATDITMGSSGDATANTISGIFSQANSGTSGQAGSVDVTATGTLSLIRGATISSSTFGQGDAGAVRISAGDVVVDRRAGPSTTSISSNAAEGTGNAGSVSVVAQGGVWLLNGATIGSSTATSGNAGSVDVRAQGVYVDGGGSNSALTTISSNARVGSTGHAGSISIAADELFVLGGGEISSSTFGSGDAGKVAINANTIYLDAAGFNDWATGIFSSADKGSTGNAGSIDVTARSLTVANGAEVASSTFGSGNAGQVTVRSDDIVVDGGAWGFSAIVSSAASGSSGQAGSVDVSATNSLMVAGGGEIASSTFASGNAGTVRVAARTIRIETFGSIDSQANGGTGNAGRVDVSVGDTLTILSNGAISSGTFSAGHAGEVNVTAARIVIDGTDAVSGSATGILSGANRRSTGDAGSVNVTASDSIRIVDGGEISSNTFAAGNAGSVVVRAGSLDADARGNFAGVYSQAIEGSTGNAGTVDVAVTGRLSLANEAEITSATFGPGNAGAVSVKAGDMLIDGGGLDALTGISSNTNAGATGRAGTVSIDVAGSLTLRAAGQISSGTFGAGDSGSVSVKAGSMLVDGVGQCPPCTGVYSQAEQGSTGRAGQVDVSVTNGLVIRDLGLITTGTNNSHDAGRVHVEAHDITIDGGGFDDITGIVSNAIEGTGSGGRVEVTASGAITLANGGSIGSQTYDKGNAGSISVQAGSLTLDGGGFFTLISSAALPGSLGNAGTVSIDVAGQLSLVDGGIIRSSTSSPTGNGGTVNVHAGDILLDRQSGASTSINAQANRDTTGHGGNVEVAADHGLVILNGAFISGSTFGDGDAGTVTVRADTVLIDKGTDSGSTTRLTGITSQTNGGRGNAGAVDVAARDIRVFDGGEISSSTFSQGNAAPVRVSAQTITLDGKDTLNSTGIYSRSESNATGNASTVQVTATGLLSILNAGAISTTTVSPGNAGAVDVRAGSLRIDGGQFLQTTGILSESSSDGNAGTIRVNVDGDITIAREGRISTGSQGGGAAGAVSVTASNISLDGLGAYDGTGIMSRAGFYASSAGTVDVSASGTIAVTNGAQISSSSDSYLGPAGSVTVNAGDVVVDGSNDMGASSINARASVYSMGQAGNVAVNASRSVLVANSGELSITNDAFYGDPTLVHPTLLTVSAPRIDVRDNGVITAASTANMPASNIALHVRDQALVDNAAILTSAVDGNGGAIMVDGPGALVLRNSQVTTSVTGTVGNGGDITIATSGLVMETGFIQANTAADTASGGNVRINTSYLIPSGNSLFVGGANPLDFHAGVFGYNVIQAAAPTGVSGAITITTPALDISAGLAPLNTQVLEVTALGRGLCDGGSSLAQAGRGGLPPSARGLLRDEDTDEAAIGAVPLAALLPVTARLTCAR